jgi:hypothetical protein
VKNDKKKVEIESPFIANTLLATTPQKQANKQKQKQNKKQSLTTIAKQNAPSRHTILPDLSISANSLAAPCFCCSKATLPASMIRVLSSFTSCFSFCSYTA